MMTVGERRAREGSVVSGEKNVRNDAGRDDKDVEMSGSSESSASKSSSISVVSFCRGSVMKAEFSI